MKQTMNTSALGRVTRVALSAGAVLCAMAVCPTTTPLRAEPVPEAERTPVDIRRTTFVVRDIDKSLPFYRDALG